MPGRRPQAQAGGRIGKIPRRVWANLLDADKRRRGVGRDQLVYIAAHNVADIWWCALRAVRKARQRELAYFAACIQDRIAYSMELGRITELPENPDDWLDIGTDLTLDDINELLKRRGPSADGQAQPPFVAQAKDGKLFVDPHLPADKKAWCADWAQRMGWQMLDADSDPALWNRMVQDNQAEKYPSVRWHFAWGPYVVVGAPDGLTDEFAYEFKVARTDNVVKRFIKPVATAQADLFACFFQRPFKRVQIHATANKKTFTFHEPVDVVRALETLKTFQKTDQGAATKPPAEWKCTPGRCEYSQVCKRDEGLGPQDGREQPRRPGNRRGRPGGGRRPGPRSPRVNHRPR